jgi:chromosome segregation protein
MAMTIAGFEQTIQQNTAARLEHESARQQLLVDKSRWEVLLVSTRQELEAARSTLHQLEIKNEREHSLVRQIQNNIERDRLRLEKLTERLEANACELLSAEAPDGSLNDDLVTRLQQHKELDTLLASHRQQLDVFMRDMAAGEADIKDSEKQAKAVGEEMQQQQLKVQTLLVRASNLIESMEELGVELKTVMSAIPEAVCVADRDNLLLEIVEKIKRLGPINLAAIEEYGTELQRKQYLDEQYDDLVLALNTLEVAIEKMDKETTQRLQQTFDDVNRGFQALFPRLFGGGRAMLELTCDNLLEAGILVMAQPPGKRNSTIHLLSGGEKAMTAVALVFAIFQLNPSPFCMLDEVDAPLDDVNVGRFCALVKEMSQFVQFLFISHNKVTMELADHLIGVTMCEPGVSRIVAVDVEQALALT